MDSVELSQDSSDTNETDDFISAQDVGLSKSYARSFLEPEENSVGETGESFMNAVEILPDGSVAVSEIL